MRHISNHRYILVGITNADKQREDCERDRDLRGETSVLHDHAHFKQVAGETAKFLCTEKCMIYIPGEPTRPVTIVEARTAR